MKTNIIIAGLLSGIFMAGAAKAQFSMSGEFRPRSEFRHGFQSLMAPDTDPAFFVSQRTRLNLNHSESRMRFRLSLQDVRVWGDNSQLNQFDNNSSVYEAWGEFNITEGISIRAGRQQLVYDNSRILGNVDWAQQGRSHDLVLLKYTSATGIQAHLGLAFNQAAENNTGTLYLVQNNYKTMQFLWLNQKFGNSAVSLLALNNGLQFIDETGSKVYFSQTLGGRFEHTTGDWNLGAETYYQTGKDIMNRNLSAWYAGLQADRKLNELFALNLGFEWLSGTDEAIMLDYSNNKNHSFTPLYGTNHKFNGHMDYFYVGNHINNVGLINPYGGFTLSVDKISLQLVYHGFISHGLLMNPDEPGKTMDRFLGSESDVILGYSFTPQFTVRAGYSQMFATRSMEVLKGGSRKEINNWAWIMLVMKPEFFKL